MSTQRILIDATCVNATGETGASRYVRTLVRALAETDRENRYIVFGFEPGLFPNLPENFEYRQAKFMKRFGPAAREMSRRAFARSAYTQDKIDVAHFTLDMGPTPRGHTRTVFTLFDLARLDPGYRKSAGDSLRMRVRTHLRYGLAARAHLIVTTSGASREMIQRVLTIPVDRIDVTFIAHDRLFCPGAPDKGVLSRFGLSGRPYALFVGEFGRQKNEDGLIEAFASSVYAEKPPGNSALVLVGDPSKLTKKSADLVSTKSLNDRVIPAGRVGDSDLLHLYRGARCLCLPSHFEGYGLPVQEAMACGTPSIISNTTSLPEIAGPTALAVDPGDTRALSEALSRLMNDDALRESLSSACLARAAQFTYEGMAARHLEIYRKAFGA